MTDPAALFQDKVRAITDLAAGQPVTPELGALLMREAGPGSARFEDLAALCVAGVRDGWLANRAAGGIRYGRAIKPAADLAGFSVDVVEMTEIAGPHHAHPRGEIDMILPVDDGARFDGAGRGWLVYGPDSAHHPTVTGGKAIILYLLPDGAIEFTRN